MPMTTARAARHSLSLGVPPSMSWKRRPFQKTVETSRANAAQTKPAFSSNAAMTRVSPNSMANDTASIHDL